jgi:hypothetical protein
MTTLWQITPIWAGETVAILGDSPELTPEIAATAKPFKTIAVNRAINVAPWADMFVDLDPTSQYWSESFDGIKVCGIDCDIDAKYAGMFYETVQIAVGHSVEIRNSTLAAIRIAEKCGAKTIMLHGIEDDSFAVFQGLAQIKAELLAKGIEVADVKPVAPAEPVKKMFGKK